MQLRVILTVVCPHPTLLSTTITDNLHLFADVGHVDMLTDWGRVTHLCVGNLTIIVSDNGLSPNPGLAITWTNDEILLIGPLGTNFSEFLI